MLRAILLGPQGSGKSTQSMLLAKRMNIHRICSGELIRDEMQRGTDFGLRVTELMNLGQLLPDDDVEHLVFSAMKPHRGWILDGYPRRISQARKLLAHHPPNLVIELHISREDCIARLTNRRVCPSGHIYHLIHRPPKDEGVCDHDGLPLLQREDDKPQAIKHRLNEYETETKPVLRWLIQHRITDTWVRADQSIEAVAAHLDRITTPYQ